VGGRRGQHAAVTDAHVLAGAAAVTLAVWQGWPAAAMAVILLWVCRAPGVLLGVVVLLSAAGVVRGEQAWASAVPRHLGAYRGWAELASDPTPFGGAVRVTVEIEGERFDAWCYGQVRRKLATREQGDLVFLAGTRRPSPAASARRDAVRHVVGRLEIDMVADIAEGDAVARAGNRVRRLLRTAAERRMSPDDAALFTGLVIGDDARQSGTMITAFRTSGLSHLTAVSGQNVVFLLAAAGPVLRRLRPWPRWAATVGLILWFMSVTRFEPSVLRAGVMAIFASLAYLTGRDARPPRLVGLTVAVLVLVDPMLVWSVGFWLSVGATLGVCVAGPWLAARLPGPSWLAAPLGVTLGAQAGVAVPSALVFGRLPLVSLVANLVAVPVAGFVMLYGIPAGIVAALAPAPLDAVVLWPAEVGTQWVATVARVGAALEPSPGWSVAGWVAVAAGLVGVVVRHSRRARRHVPS